MSQLATQSQYSMDTERPMKRPRFTRGLKNKFYSRRKKQFIVRPGFFALTRNSNQDTGQNCHNYHVGADAVRSLDVAATFSMNNVAGAAELQSLFDNYRIVGVRYRFVLDRQTDNTSTVTQYRGYNVRVTWAHDFNDGTPISRSQLMQRAKLKEVWLCDSAPVSPWYNLKPACLVQAYESPTSTAYQPRWKQWMDTNDLSAPHYGIKYSYDNLAAGLFLRLEAQLSMEFKGVS